MFILIPLVLMLASAIGISIIFFRKMPYLNKLTPETHLSAQSSVLGYFLIDLLPELSERLQNLKLKEYGNLLFIELEKFLRRLRVISLKIDRISESWIKKIRKGNISRTTTSVITEKTEITETPILKVQSTLKTNTEEIKKEEQRLIIEIAKNPKDFKLYEILGDLYVKMKSFSDAKESFEAAIELSPHDEKLQKRLSQVAKKLIK